MNSFVYYLPGVESFQPEMLDEFQIGYAFEASPEFRCGAGPDGTQGILLAEVRADTGTNRYLPNQQVWRRVPCSKAWCGMLTDRPPGPGDLIRSEGGLDGHPVTLCDGNDWIIPAARYYEEIDGRLQLQSSVPRKIDYDDEGNITLGDVAGDYQKIWTIANRWYDFRTSGKNRDGETIQIDDDDVLHCLNFNYRVWKAEVGLLGLLDDKKILEVLDASADMPTLKEFIKKKAIDVNEP